MGDRERNVKIAVGITIGVVVVVSLYLWSTTKITEKKSLSFSNTIASGYDNLLISDKNGNIKSLLFPAKMIVLWSGGPAEIPDGWGLCDGTKGTPDLRGKFVVGINPNANKNPAHSIYEMNVQGGEEGHILTNEELPSPTRSKGGYLTPYGEDRFGVSVPTDFTNSSKPLENRPPYWALAYIMKLPDV